uniref:Anoctamin n=1 Tax=Macrostomum lignano TaxID=282301 RepID=A0A1I8F6A8_9PLAT
FGFVVLFVAAMPLAPLFAMLNNVIEIRLDAWKMVALMRRPVARRARDIGAWFGILTSISALSVIPKLVYQFTDGRGSLDGYMSWRLSLFNVSDFETQSVPRIADSAAEVNVTQCRYRTSVIRLTALTGTSTAPRLHWHVLAARMAFVLVFEGTFVLVLKALIDLAVPDKPGVVKEEMKRERELLRKALSAPVWPKDSILSKEIRWFEIKRQVFRYTFCKTNHAIAGHNRADSPFVEFDTVPQAQAWMESQHNLQLGDVLLSLQYSMPRSESRRLDDARSDWMWPEVATVTISASARPATSAAASRAESCASLASDGSETRLVWHALQHAPFAEQMVSAKPKNACILRDPLTRSSKCCALIEFDSVTDSMQLVQMTREMDIVELDGKAINIDYANSRRRRLRRCALQPPSAAAGSRSRAVLNQPCQAAGHQQYFFDPSRSGYLYWDSEAGCYRDANELQKQLQEQQQDGNKKDASISKESEAHPAVASEPFGKASSIQKDMERWRARMVNKQKNKSKQQAMPALWSQQILQQQQQGRERERPILLLLC